MKIFVMRPPECGSDAVLCVSAGSKAACSLAKHTDQVNCPGLQLVAAALSLQADKSCPGFKTP